MLPADSAMLEPTRALPPVSVQSAHCTKSCTLSTWVVLPADSAPCGLVDSPWQLPASVQQKMPDSLTLMVGQRITGEDSGRR